MKAGGRALWRATLRRFELGADELILLKEAARTADLLDDLQATIDRDGPVLAWGQGTRANPALPELRQHRIVLSRILAALRIPKEDQE